MFPDEPNNETAVTLESQRSGVIEDAPFYLLVLGDWTGDGTKRGLADRKPVEIDRDNFDDVMNALGPAVRVDLGGNVVDLEFRSLDDFHPDELFRRVPIFAELRDLRKRLRNSDTFNLAAREVREWTSGEEREPAAAAPQPATEPASENLLDAILSKPEGGAAAPKAAVSSDISNLVGRLVRPHLVSVDENEQSAMVAAVDEAISGTIRSILHDRGFQLLEAAWRGLFFLVRRTDTASDLKIFIFDIAKDELGADLKAEGSNSVVRKVLAAGHDDEPWAAVIGNFAFLPDVDDIASLIRLGRLGSSIRAPFISHMRPDLIGVSSLADHPDPDEWKFTASTDEGKLWATMRGLPEASFIGLAMPRFLARLPYGASTDPTEAFSFEEVTDGWTHDDYLWVNGCFAVALLLAQSFREFEWDFGPRFIQDIDGLPLHIFKKDGQTVFQPCAEVQLSQRAAESLTAYGIMPVVSFKETDRIRLARFQSVAEPVGELKGRWS